MCYSLRRPSSRDIARSSKQGLDQRTFRQRAVAALGNDVLEHPFHALQVGDLRPDVGKVDGGDVSRFGIGRVALVDET